MIQVNTVIAPARGSCAPFLYGSSQAIRSLSATVPVASRFDEGIVGCTPAIEKDLEQVRAQCMEPGPRRHLAIGGDQLIYGCVDAAVTTIWRQRGGNVAPLRQV